MKSSCWIEEQSGGVSSCSFTRAIFFGVLLALNYSPPPSRAAVAPTATLKYTTTNNASIHGGVATIGTSGSTYFSILSSPGIAANVKKLSSSGTVLWTVNCPDVGPSYDIYPIPALDASGAKLYIGSDYGVFYCRKTTDGTKADGWTDFVVPGTGDRRIRSGAALDPNNPLGATVYFHCNNGYLYALDANTGAQRWSPAYTANVGGPPTAPDPSRGPGFDWHAQPVSSSPVVDSSGVVYVGSADGAVY